MAHVQDQVFIIGQYVLYFLKKSSSMTESLHREERKNGFHESQLALKACICPMKGSQAAKIGTFFIFTRSTSYPDFLVFFFFGFFSSFSSSESDKKTCLQIPVFTTQ